MDEISTTTLNKATKQQAMNDSEAMENLEGDDLIFYHSLRQEMDQLKKNPSLQTIHNILNYSKSLR